jgi:hypothetical protein
VGNKPVKTLCLLRNFREAFFNKREVPRISGFGAAFFAIEAAE